MPEYISRDAALIVLDWDCASQDALEAIKAIPAADVVEVRHAHWCVTDAYPHNVYCSACFKTFAQGHWEIWKDGSLPRDYCPSCGAKMDLPELPKEET